MTELTPAEVVGQAIRNARKAADLNQDALAERLGVAQATVCRWEDGTRSLTVSNLAAIADALGTTAADLLADQPSNPHPSGWDRLEAKLDRILNLLEDRRGCTGEQAERRKAVLASFAAGGIVAGTGPQVIPRSGCGIPGYCPTHDGRLFGVCGGTLRDVTDEAVESRMPKDE